MARKPRNGIALTSAQRVAAHRAAKKAAAASAAPSPIVSSLAQAVDVAKGEDQPERVTVKAGKAPKRYNWRDAPMVAPKVRERPKAQVGFDAVTGEPIYR